MIKNQYPAFRKPYGYFSWPISILILLILLFIVIREPIFKHVLNRKIELFNKEHNANISYESLTVNGFSEISMHNFKATEIGKTPILTATKISVNLNFWKLFRKRISLENIEIDNCSINIIKKKNVNNYQFLFKSNKNKEENQDKEKKLSNIAHKIINLLFDLVPQKMNISKFSIAIASDNHQLNINIPTLNIIDHQFSSKLFINESGVNSTIYTIGRADKEANELSVKLFGNQHQPIKLPWLEFRNNATVCLDTFFLNITNSSASDENITKIGGSIKGDKIVVFQKRIAADTIKFDKIETQFNVNIGEDYIEMDSSSVFNINQLILNPHIYYRSKPSKKVILSLNKPFFDAQQLFNALPRGLFTNFEGIKVEGQLSYQGYLEIDFSIPDSMILKSDLLQKNFKILKSGATNFNSINDPFNHQIFENNKEFKTIHVDPSNSSFVSFEHIPISLKNAILMSEDGCFFTHGGFLIGAFRESVITNIKTKKFSRGGSTISMQLVKNLFLTRNKNIARKLEELLIVWMIERNRMVSKERMFEIYVNIIEWGPGVYGLSDATKYYFNKDVSKLTLDESIYLASIIPSPKNFRYLFNADGTFKEYILNYYQLVLKRMVEHEFILQSEADATEKKVSILGEAKNCLSQKKDSIY